MDINETDARRTLERPDPYLRIRFLLSAAAREDGEGRGRVAAALRRMAEEALPIGLSTLVTHAR